MVLVALTEAASGLSATSGVGLVGAIAENAAISMAENAVDQVVDNQTLMLEMCFLTVQQELFAAQLAKAK